MTWKDGQCKRCEEPMKLSKRVCPNCAYAGGGLYPKVAKWLSIGCLLCIPLVTAPIGLMIIAVTLPLAFIVPRNKPAEPIE